jgi:hypothetical protein
VNGADKVKWLGRIRYLPNTRVAATDAGAGRKTAARKTQHNAKAPRGEQLVFIGAVISKPTSGVKELVRLYRK